MPLELAYFYGSEAEQYSFYRIPKVLLIDQHYRGVSMEAKVLYGLMLDRMGLSVRSGWMDSEGRVYI
ncbi:MAG: replication initiator A domain-containing protein, partial [Oscillospiraceae bacterium]|nr:replication initiator A domain-containing protein [Oscillospiraceae bacterium]